MSEQDKRLDYRYCRRRGAALGMMAVSIPLVLAFGALTVDYGFRCVVKAQLQNAADAAALAGATGYFSDAALKEEHFETDGIVRDRAYETGAMNPTLGEPTIFEEDHVQLGVHDFDHPSGPLGEAGRWNAVQATAHRTKGSTNGPVPYFFAAIFGLSEGDLTATARAAMNDRVQGYRAQPGGFLPITINSNLYATLYENGPDDWSYDGASVLPFGDDIPEVRLFPWKLSKDGSDPFNDGYSPQDLTYAQQRGSDGAGNFGTLNIGIGNEGTAAFEEQIMNGITPEQFEAEFGTSKLTFSTDAGSPTTYTATGNPGLSVGLKDTVAALTGRVVGFFLHRQVWNSGSNATFEIVGIRYGRIVEVALTGKPSERKLGIRPVAYTDGGLIVNDSAPSADGQLGRVLLVR